MRIVLTPLRWLLARLAVVLVLRPVVGRARDAWRRRSGFAARRREAMRTPLPSLYDLYPAASAAPRRRLGLRPVPLERIVGTVRRPTQNTADFLPLPQLRGRNWEARWQRLLGATDRLTVLPPVELIKLGDNYYVVDGHNRVAAALRAGALEIDADVTELLKPGHAKEPPPTSSAATTLIGADEIRHAAAGNHSAAVLHPNDLDQVSRTDLLRSTALPSGDPEVEPPEEPAERPNEAAEQIQEGP